MKTKTQIINQLRIFDIILCDAIRKRNDERIDQYCEKIRTLAWVLYEGNRYQDSDYRDPEKAVPINLPTFYKASNTFKQEVEE